MSKHKQFKLSGRIQLIIVTALVVTGTGWFYTYYATNVAPAQKVIDERQDRIVAIYDSLNLGQNYKLTSSNVFGQKRPYEWDSSRTYSSSRVYVRNANVDVTVAELRTAIEKAGFHYFEEPYPGSTFIQLHFKSDHGEYLRLTVSSKPRDDAIQTTNKNENSFNQAISMPANSGPSNVLIKVNLDDNNE